MNIRDNDLIMWLVCKEQNKIDELVGVGRDFYGWELRFLLKFEKQNTHHIWIHWSPRAVLFMSYLITSVIINQLKFIFDFTTYILM